MIKLSELYRVQIPCTSESHLVCLEVKSIHALLPSQQTENICITFVQQRPNVRRQHKCHVNGLRLLG